MPVIVYSYSNGLDLYVIEPQIFMTDMEGGLHLKADSAAAYVLVKRKEGTEEKQGDTDLFEDLEDALQIAGRPSAARRSVCFTDQGGKKRMLDLSSMLDIAYIVDEEGSEDDKTPIRYSSLFTGCSYSSTSTRIYQGPGISRVLS